MCTSLTLPTPNRRLFGRTLDLDTHFGERVTLTPRRYAFAFNGSSPQPNRYAMLGMAAVADGYPLYAEAMNERGLCMAGLRFAGNAVYADAPAVGKINLTPWELIPYFLGRYATVNEVRNALREVCVVDRPFARNMPNAPLHWHVTDQNPDHGSLVLEITTAGMRVYEDAVGVLTNNPPYPYQLAQYAAFASLSARPRRAESPAGADFSSLGDGARGLPGDYSSASRFIRAATLRRWVAEWMQTQPQGGEAGTAPSPLDRFFAILGAVSPMAGAVLTEAGSSHRTLYTCCMDGEAGAYHYFTEEDTSVRSVSLTGANAEGEALIFP